MPTLKGLYGEALKQVDLVVVGPHSDWLELPEDERVYSERAITHQVNTMRKMFKKARPGRISPSGVGECQRRVLFSFHGAPQVGENLDTYELFGLGEWGHSRWQAEGLSFPFDAPYMTDAEVWVHRPDLRMGGSIDAVLYDGSLFELKTAGWNVYDKVVNQDNAPKFEHDLQLHAYFKLAEVDIGSVVYEERSSGNYHEFRVTRSAKVEKELDRRLARLHAYIDADDLPAMLDGCEMKTGTVYKRCPFREHCHLVAENKVDKTGAPR